MSFGGQGEGGRTHPEVAWGHFRFVEFERKVELATDNILKAWIRAFWCHLLRLESNVIKGEILGRKQQWLFSNDTKKNKKIKR